MTERRLMDGAVKLLLGTTNPAKINLVRAAVRDLPIELLTPADVDIHIAVAEEGQTTLENAAIKAQAYFEMAGLPTLAMDGALWIEKFPDDQQPGVQVKRFQGAKGEATEREVLDTYRRELAAVGGESLCRWEGCMVLVLPGRRVFSSTFSFETLLTCQRRGDIRPGISMAPITIDPRSGKYFSEMGWDEFPEAPWIREFVSQHLDEL